MFGLCIEHAFSMYRSVFNVDSVVDLFIDILVFFWCAFMSHPTRLVSYIIGTPMLPHGNLIVLFPNSVAILTFFVHDAWAIRRS